MSAQVAGGRDGALATDKSQYRQHSCNKHCRSCWLRNRRRRFEIQVPAIRRIAFAEACLADDELVKAAGLGSAEGELVSLELFEDARPCHVATIPPTRPLAHQRVQIAACEMLEQRQTILVLDHRHSAHEDWRVELEDYIAARGIRHVIGDIPVIVQPVVDKAAARGLDEPVEVVISVLWAAADLYDAHRLHGGCSGECSRGDGQLQGLAGESCEGVVHEVSSWRLNGGARARAHASRMRTR